MAKADKIFFLSLKKDPLYLPLSEVLQEITA